MSITLLIIIATCILSYLAFNDEYKKQKMLFIPTAILRHKEWYRMLSSGFIHADFNHLLWNMFSLYSFGSLVEMYFNVLFGQWGGVIYVLFYLLGIIVSGIPDLLRHKNDQFYGALGASGAVCAVIFAAILFQPTSTIYFFMIVPIPAVIYGVLFIAISSYLDKISFGNIGHLAHITGSVYGFLIPIALYPNTFLLFIEELKRFHL